MLKFSDLIIDPSASLRVSLQRMTRNRCGVLFVCDEKNHLVGVLSDGDVRRSLLDDTLLASPLEKIMNTDPIAARTTDEATGLVRRLNIVAVPIVDDEGQVCQAVLEDLGSVVILSPGEKMPGWAKTGGVALGVIPARGGSKRIPRKNLAKVAGKTLLAWTIEAAKSANSISHVVLSTDDAEIAEVGRSAGVEVPWLRPASLSGDSAPTLDVLLHALEWASRELTPTPQFAVLLEPTAPLRSGEQIDEAVSMLIRSDADCVASVCEVPHVFHPEEALVIADGALRPFLPDRTMNFRHLRNQQKSSYVLNGLVYAFRVNSLLSACSLFGRKTIPMITRWEEFLDVDTREDLELATFKMERYRAKIS